LELAVTAKKYMVPMLLVQPHVAGIMAAGSLAHWQYRPGKHAPILDSKNELDAALTRDTRRAFQNRLDEIVQSASSGAALNEHDWQSLRATAQPGLDSSGGPTFLVQVGGEVTSVGGSRVNILNAPAGSEFAVGLVKARLREELQSSVKHKTARADVESDLILLQELLESRTSGLASTGSFATNTGTLAAEDIR
jgi:hypothetical protein